MNNPPAADADDGAWGKEKPQTRCINRPRAITLFPGRTGLSVCAVRASTCHSKDCAALENRKQRPKDFCEVYGLHYWELCVPALSLSCLIQTCRNVRMLMFKSRRANE